MLFVQCISRDSIPCRCGNIPTCRGNTLICRGNIPGYRGTIRKTPRIRWSFSQCIRRFPIFLTLFSYIFFFAFEQSVAFYFVPRPYAYLRLHRTALLQCFFPLRTNEIWILRVVQIVPAYIGCDLRVPEWNLSSSSAGLSKQNRKGRKRYR